MRKMIIEMDPARFIKQSGFRMFEVVESIELIELLRLDLEQGVKVTLVEVGLKEGYTLDDMMDLEDIDKTGVSEILGVIKQDGNKYTIVAKRVVPESMRQMSSQFDMDLVWTTPTIYSGNRMVLSVIGESADLRKLLTIMEGIGDIIKVSYHRPVIHEHNLMTVLTDRQKEVMVAAKRHGYYDYPRRINTEELADKVGLSKATVVEHLRKAENRLMTHIMTAY